MIRCGAFNYKTKIVSNSPGYTNILIHSGNKYEFNPLSPYHLTNTEGQILENIWQGSKIYPKVYKTKQFSYVAEHYGRILIWEHLEEIHVNSEGEVTTEYWNWRDKLFNNPYPVRYPNMKHHRSECLGIYYSEDNINYQLLNYVEARKKVYCAEYIKAFKYHTDNNTAVGQQINQLKQMLADGELLQIVEVDGPKHGKAAPYNNVLDGEIGEELVATMEVNEENIKSALNNTEYPFGHGYVIATLLLGKEEWFK